MNNKWPTKIKDIQFAEQAIQQYAEQSNTEQLGLFEIVVNDAGRQLDFRLSDWVKDLAHHYLREYGIEQGDFIIRKIVSYCLTKGSVIH